MAVVCRRTADVRSVGYSELFVLSREDVLAAFKDHPEAEVTFVKMFTLHAGTLHSNDRFSGQGRAVRPVCVCVCLGILTIASKLSDL